MLSARIHADHVVVELEGLNDRESSAAWRGALVGVPRTKLPPLRKGEVYLADLIGFAVVNRNDQLLGNVTGMLDTAAHAVMRVAGEDGRERLIRWCLRIWMRSTPEARRVRVDWQLIFDVAPGLTAGRRAGCDAGRAGCESKSLRCSRKWCSRLHGTA